VCLGKNPRSYTNGAKLLRVRLYHSLPYMLRPPSAYAPMLCCVRTYCFCSCVPRQMPTAA
jgi:hypothetical protein